MCHKKVVIFAIIMGVLLGLLNALFVAFPRYWSKSTAAIEFDVTKVESGSTFTPVSGWWVNLAQDGSGVPAVRGQGAESVIAVTLPQADAYQFGVILTLLPGGEANNQIQVYMNDTLLGELELQVQEEAQNFELIVPAAVVQEGTNILRMVYSGVSTHSDQPNSFLFHSIILQKRLILKDFLLIVGEASLALIPQGALILVIGLTWQSRHQAKNWFVKQLGNPWEIVGRLALLVLGIVFAVIAVEIGLWLILPSQSRAISGDANPWEQYVGWGGNPYQTRINTKFQTVIRYNSKGLRDVEYSYEKPPDTFRILILGDSFVEAEQIGNMAETFPRQIEDLLNQHRRPNGPQFQVVAAGFSGWGTDQHLLYYRHEGYKYQSDLVLIAFTSNDVADSYLPWRMIQTGWPDGCVYKPYFELKGEDLILKNFPYDSQKVWAPDKEAARETMDYIAWFKSYLYERTRVYRLFVDAVWGNFPRTNVVLTWRGLMPVKVEEKPGSCRQAFKPQGDPMANIYVFATEDSIEGNEAWSLIHNLFKELKDVTQKSGAILAVVANSESAPTAYSRQGQLLFTDPEGRQWDWSKVYNTLGTISQQEEIPFMALQPIFDQSSYEFDDLYVPDDGHYNLDGHRLAAQTIYEWLVEAALVP